DLQHHALHPQRVARPDRLRPEQLSATAYDPARDRQTTGDQQSHGYSCRMPAARRQPTEQRLARRLVVEMKRLWVVFGGEALDLRGIHRVRPAHETLPNGKV